MILFMYILLFIVFLLLAVGFYQSRKVLHIAVKTEEKIIEYETNNNSFDKKWFESLNKEEVLIQSPFGYRLSGYYIESDKNTGKTIVFCHGVTVSHITSVKYARIFYDRGWNVLIYDHCRHGKSGGKTTTFGYYEKYDLNAVINYVRARVGANAVIGIHGESMGAATVLQYGGLGGNVDFYIADCPYSSLWEQLLHVLKTTYRLPAFPLLYIADFFIFLQGRFHIKDVNPIEDVKKIEKPVLFIHGSDDTYVPTRMSVEMYEVKSGMKELYIASGAGHARSINVNREKYEKVVFSFLNKIGIAE